jgi:hypothetical protein
MACEGGGGATTWSATGDGRATTGAESGSLLELRLTDRHRLRDRLVREGGVVLALDGMQPDVGHEVLWVIRDCLTGEPLLARSLLSGTEADLAGLLREVKDALPVPILGVVSDGQQSIGRAVASALPGIPHQLCQFH